MMPIETKKWDPVDYLDTPEMISAYLETAVETGDPALLAAVLGDIARAKGMSEVAREAGITREGLYKALSAEGDPKLSTFLGVIRSLGLKISVKPAQPEDDAKALRHAS